ncbi:DUF4404 family protein [Gilvimarinus algae]|uniref:DUF4404 family protein n=1 Tax=Gilvimarinus algae TaxID=3058037 RepID=A0ABT8TIM3_9GAMM|nr:DUF4404 family protein [Gilvimarinus sp. SDUM040014]MDO3383944.1 DUF4404 family protein [Gilvimarinus sp. SDUM040014]
MSEEKLDHLITRLHDLFGNDEVSPAQQRLMAELERHTHAAGTAESPDPRPVDTLEAMLEDFEEEHPQVSAVLGEIINALRNMGM